MQANEPFSQKRAVEQLNFGSKTRKRASWEAWEFTIVGPNQVRVTNASYGHLKADHSYTVRVEERDGLALPASCDCPADQHREGYACKHRVGLAIIGGPTVLNAAAAFSLNTSTPDREIATDGGSPETDTCPNGDSLCDGPDGDDLPCFDCYELPRRGA